MNRLNAIAVFVTYCTVQSELIAITAIKMSVWNREASVKVVEGRGRGRIVC